MIDKSRVRQFVVQYFSDEELNDLSFDYFPFVYNEFTIGMTKSQKVRLLIESCNQRGKMPDLLAALQRERPNAYDGYFAGKPTTPLPEGAPVERNQRQIFISHSHQDAEFAQRLASDLRVKGWEIWIAQDSIRPGEKWVEAINRGLAESGVFVLVLTEAAANSRWVQSETNAAIEMEHRGVLRFLPIEVEPVSVPPLWKSYQWISFQAGYDSGLATLLLEVEPASAPPSTNPTSAPMQQKEPEIAAVKPDPAATGSLWPPIKRRLSDRPSLIWPGAALALLVALLLITFWPDSEPGVTVTPEDTDVVAADSTPNPTATNKSESAPAILASPSEMSTPLPEPTETASPDPSPTATATATATFEPPSLPPAEGQLGDTWTRPRDGMAMVFVPGGTFKMGSDRQQDPDARNVEFPQRDVALDSFWIDSTEVTNAMYNQCADAKVCAQSEYAADPTLGGANYPVVGVSWDDADVYCQWVGGQLPTEAQWEYAARSDDGRIYPWGNETPTCDLAQFGLCSEGTAPVGRTSPAGDSWVGAADMAGNVWEWVADWYDDLYYEYGEPNNPTGPEFGTQKAVRGGSWLNSERKFLRVATRADARPSLRNSSNGFRCAISFNN